MERCDINETILASEGGVSSCSMPRRSGTLKWMGLGLAAAGTVTALLIMARNESRRIEEQIKSTMPLQT